MKTKFLGYTIPLFTCFVIFLIANLIAVKYFNLVEFEQAIYSANLLLFLICVLVVWLNKRTSEKGNANAAVRGIMISMLLKLVILAIAAVLYIQTHEFSQKIPLVCAWFIMYIVYTYFEVTISIKRK